MQTTAHILMIRPAAFGFNEETAVSNTFQNKPIGGSDTQQAALQEFDNAVQTLRDAGISVRVIEDSPVPAKPDALFPNNWFSTHSDGSLVLYPMLTPNRRLERRDDILQQLQEAFAVRRIIDLSPAEQEHRFLEGTGSIVFDHDARIAYACLSPRTDPGLLDQLCASLSYKAVCFLATDAQGVPVYHTNVIMSVGPEYVLLAADTINDPQERDMVLATIKDSGKEPVLLSQEQVSRFAGNVLSLQTTGGKDLLVLSTTALNALLPGQIRQLEQYTSLLPVAVPTIEHTGGGGIRCMIAQLFLPPQMH